ncbi:MULTISPECIES: DNA gyrase inhibitor YacG [unclassified Roseivivax]|uniref:DNA gyrase inhibitor YacG n=1 Tax=Roseivivax sp. GX 12232 TaxID=2900547 RepID=UPI001E3C68CB|nr:DNA gyrase inhibitor YacG [Roseivivax sp. GX 12232]MCE0504392.1 DNA gyrase inhibitor YacG [Roseivivax sp. GX 12232]
MSCPICNADTKADYRPFCSRRCADLDLSKWFSGGYAVPSENPEDVEEALDQAMRARAKSDTTGESTH